MTAIHLRFKQEVEFWHDRVYSMLDIVDAGRMFDGDFDHFMTQVEAIEEDISRYITNTFEEVQNIELALTLLAKLEVSAKMLDWKELIQRS